MAQRWLDLLFAHWKVTPHQLRPFIPEGLEIDTYDGSAWLAVVPFRMDRIRARGLPPLPGLSAFVELNLRTYVVRDGRPGVWFLSLEATHPLAVRFARRTFHLPYMDADMDCTAEDEAIRYRSERLHRGEPPAMFQGRYGPAGEVFTARPGTLEHWLTERYCLHAADEAGRLLLGEIHHVPWPLQPAWAEIGLNTMADPFGISLDRPPDSLLFARGIEVALWWPERGA
jgi:hypothetical protein